MSLEDDLMRARDLLMARPPFEPNPYDRLMTEALNSAEETGRAKERARFQALLEEWETDEPGTPMLAVMGLRRVLNSCPTCGHSTAPIWFGQPGSGDHSEDDGSCFACGPELGKRCADAIAREEAGA